MCTNEVRKNSRNKIFVQKLWWIKNIIKESRIRGYKKRNGNNESKKYTRSKRKNARINKETSSWKATFTISGAGKSGII